MWSIELLADIVSHESSDGLWLVNLFLSVPFHVGVKEQKGIKESQEVSFRLPVGTFMKTATSAGSL